MCFIANKFYFNQGICKDLDWVSLGNLSCTCKFFRNEARQPQYWQHGFTDQSISWHQADAKKEVIAHIVNFYQKFREDLNLSPRRGADLFRLYQLMRPQINDERLQHVRDREIKKAINLEIEVSIANTLLGTGNALSFNDARFLDCAKTLKMLLREGAAPDRNMNLPSDWVIPEEIMKAWIALGWSMDASGIGKISKQEKGVYSDQTLLKLIDNSSGKTFSLHNVCLDHFSENVVMRILKKFDLSQNHWSDIIDLIKSDFSDTSLKNLIEAVSGPIDELSQFQLEFVISASIYPHREAFVTSLLPYCESFALGESSHLLPAIRHCYGEATLLSLIEKVNYLLPENMNEILHALIDSGCYSANVYTAIFQKGSHIELSFDDSFMNIVEKALCRHVPEEVICALLQPFDYLFFAKNMIALAYAHGYSEYVIDQLREKL